MIDPEGYLCAIYRGSIDDGILAKHLANLEINDDALRMSSLPFQGQWQSGAVPRAQPLAFVEELIDAGLLGPARLYVNEYKPSLQKDTFFAQLLSRLESMEDR